MKPLSLLATSPLAVLFLATMAHTQDLLGVSGNGDVYIVDSKTGTGLQLGVSGFPTLDGLATTGCIRYAVSGNTLVTINWVTGAATAVGTIALSAVRALAFNPADGLLYAVEDGGNPSAPDVLYTIDPASLAVAAIGSTGYTGVVGLAFRVTTLYAWDVGSGTGAGLLRVNTQTGACLDLNPAVGGSAATEQFLLAAGVNDQLYTGRNELYAVDPLGVTTLVGSGGYSDLLGLEGRYDSKSLLIYCGSQKNNSCGVATGVSITSAPGPSLIFGALGARYGKHGVLLYSPNGPVKLPFQGGFLCVNPNGMRTSHVLPAYGGSPANPCDAHFEIDIYAYASGALGGNPAAFLQTPGQRVSMQWWGRDTAAHGSYLSYAVQYSVCP